ncbi:MAG TPA: hypothetical protein VHA56_20595 [Mucilaginibacter sp.]|nr:hypothetical protein [Mucilaginibacter sp.]
MGKGFDRLSTGLSIYTTGKSYYNIANGDHSVLTYSDATVGTIGLGAKFASYFYGIEIPYVGEAVSIYGTARTIWDVGNLLRPGIAEYEESSKQEGCNICLLPH